MTVSSDPAAPRREDLVWPSEPDAATAPKSAPPAPSTAVNGPGTTPVPKSPATSLAIGRLRRVDPAELWRASDFATWLAGNLRDIGALIGTTLTAAPAGGAPPGTVVATDASGGQVRIVVELGPSSDETFGVLMRQLVASGAGTAVWICAHARDEHLGSVEWLNREITGHMHLVAVEAVRIDDSIPAPIFRLALRAEPGRAAPVSKPAVSGG